MNCSRKFNDRYRPEPQAPMNPQPAVSDPWYTLEDEYEIKRSPKLHMWRITITVCLETILVIALIAVLTAVTVLCLMPL